VLGAILTRHMDEDNPQRGFQAGLGQLTDLAGATVPTLGAYGVW